MRRSRKHSHTRQCPYCAETIQAAATVCRFCGRDVPAATPNFPAAPAIAAESVAALLTALVGKSLVVYEEADDGGRYHLLETMRRYCQDRLSAGAEAGAAFERHRAYFLELADEARRHMEGPEQAQWLRRLDTEHDNLRAALDSCREDAADPALGVRMAAALARFWEVRGYYGEGRQRLAGALERVGDGEQTQARAGALTGAGVLAMRQSDYEAANRFFTESLAIQRALGDNRGSASALANLGLVAIYHGDYPQARALLEEALALRRELGDELGIAASLANLGNVCFEQGDYAAAQALYEESLARDQAAGNPQGSAITMLNLGLVAEHRGDLAQARAMSEDGLAICRELGDQYGIAASLHSLSGLSRRQGDYPTARALQEEALAIRRAVGDREGISLSLGSLWTLAQDEGDKETARAVLTESLLIRAELGDKWGIVFALEGFGQMANAPGQAGRAARLLGAADALRQAIGSPLPPNERAAYEHTLATARAALGEEAFGSAWTEGQGMSLEQAVEYALTDRA